MASWKKHFRPTNSILPASTGSGSSSGKSVLSTFSSWLPEVYQGPPNRLQRYAQYDNMDKDSEVHAALDTIAEFSTSPHPETGLPFDIEFNDEPSTHEVEILTKTLRQWCKVNQMNKRVFDLFRSAIKYGDQVFIRDPETYELLWIDPQTVERVVINESKGKIPEIYYIKNLDRNKQMLTGTDTTKKTAGGYGSSDSIFPNAPLTGQANFQHGNAIPALTNSGTYGGAETTFPVDAAHVVHLSLTSGMDDAWPFGVSVLEKSFKIYKQKELLEDAILIYRVHRAPERRVFFIDTGTMPPERAQQYLERIRYEVQQKRIPSRTGGGDNIMDSSYNPLSMLEDYYFAQTCLSLDTEIPLLDGRTLTLNDIIDEYKKGKINYVYSQNSNQQLEYGKISWAGVTKKNTQTLKVHLDNGEHIQCTPDHRFIMRDGSEVEAQNLASGDSLMPLYFKKGKTSSKQKENPYLRYIDNSDGKVKWVHTAICGKAKPGKETEIHHIDFNSRNNNPDNLIEMATEEHRELHKQVGSYSIGKQWNSHRGRKKLLKGIRSAYQNMSDERVEMLSNRNRKNALHGWRNPESNTNSSLKSLKKTQKRVAKKKTIRYSDDMFCRMLELYNDGHDSVIKMCKAIRSDSKMQKLFREANPNIIRDGGNMHFRPSDRSLNSLVNVAGYGKWGEFKESYSYNHSVKEVEWIDTLIDTGDITVESPSGSHIFLTAAGVFVHNSDGRGSKVEVLPGGENLGDIDDLKYFNNRMFRSLAVPSSYLPTGPDDGTAQFNDGRIGSAFQQEFRFTKYCKRLQTALIDPLDREFKLFLKKKGINIDSGLFELTFNEPQNFNEYRKIEIDSAFASVFSQLENVPYISKRMLLQRYLGWDEKEILENEKLIQEERKGVPDETGGDASLRQVGASPGGFEDFSDAEFPDDDEGDLGDMDDFTDDIGGDVSDAEAQDFGTDS